MGSRQPEEAEVLDLTRFSTEFNGESDRGAVLVAASRLDEVLKALKSPDLRPTVATSCPCSCSTFFTAFPMVPVPTTIALTMSS